MNLNQVTVPSTDLEKSIAFYSSLGLKLIVSALPGYARFECPEGDSTFSIHRVATRSQDEGIVIYFECGDLDAKVAELQSRGIAFDQMPVMQTWLWNEACLRDPDGNKVILYYAGENRKNPPWRVK